MLLKENGNHDPNKRSKESSSREWTTPKEKEKFPTKSQAKSKLLEVRNHNIYFKKMAKEAPDVIKKPESVSDLLGKGKECLFLAIVPSILMMIF